MISYLVKKSLFGYLKNLLIVKIQNTIILAAIVTMIFDFTRYIYLIQILVIITSSISLFINQIFF